MCYLKQVWGYGEVLALERKDIDYEAGVIHVNKTLSRDINDKPKISRPKTSSGIREVPLTSHLIQVFKKNYNFKYLFTQPDGSFISTVCINTMCKRIAKDAGIKVIWKHNKKNGKGARVDLKTSTMTTHVIRHTFRY